MNWPVSADLTATEMDVGCAYQTVVRVHGALLAPDNMTAQKDVGATEAVQRLVQEYSVMFFYPVY